MRSTKIFCVSVLMLAVSACARGLWSTEVAPVFPALDPGKGRVFLYRSSATGTAHTPEAMLNGEKLGKLDRRGVFIVDVLPGSYAATTTMTNRVVHFSVRAGERKYVRFHSGIFESHMHPELVDAAKGEAEVSGIGFLGPVRK